MAGGPADARDRTAAIEQLLAERGDQLMRAAIALAGGRTEGEDLLQAALERLLRNWRRVDSDPEGYLRRTKYNLAADGWRHRGRWHGRLRLLQAQHAAAAPDWSAAVDRRDALLRLLHQLPPRQRTVIVLRYWEQGSEAETAELLGCSVGAVKSAASRGMRRLREIGGAESEPGSGLRPVASLLREHTP
jgi:RNA polymerase sigma-70 factor (sigma-E family)